MMARKPAPKPSESSSHRHTEATPSLERPSPGHTVANTAKYQKSADYKTIYANSMRVGISQWDITLILGLTVDGDSNEAVVEEHFAVKFSPHYFKALVGSCNAAIGQWEASFGQLAAGPGQAAQTAGLEDVFGTLVERLKSAENKPAQTSD